MNKEHRGGCAAKYSLEVTTEKNSPPQRNKETHFSKPNYSVLDLWMKIEMHIWAMSTSICRFLTFDYQFANEETISKNKEI